MSQPPQYILDSLAQAGFTWDPNRYSWDPTTMNIVDRTNGAQYWQGGIPDPSLGTDVQYSTGATEHFGPGENPHFFLSAGDNYASQGGVAAAVPGTELYNQLSDDARTRSLRGVAQVGGLVGGAAALGNTAWGQGGGTTTGSGTATVSGSNSFAGASGAGGADLGGLISGGMGPQAALGGGGVMGGGLGLGGWLTVGSLAAQALQGNDDIVTNSTSAPPAYIAPYLSDAAQQAANLYQQGNYVAPITQSAIDYGTNVLGGSYLNSNPHLDETFRRASGAVTNQVQSNFGTSGRNPRGIDAAGFAQEGYNDLANQIYGGNYQAERQRQQQLIPYAGMLGAYTNPGTALDDYIARLGNLSGRYGTTTSSTPTDSNWLSGAAGLGLALMR